MNNKINKLFNSFLMKHKGDEYYVNEIIRVDKNLWEDGIARVDSWEVIKSKLLKFRTDSTTHPFISELKKDSLCVSGRYDIENFMKKVYAYGKIK